ncbi:MFS transporter [Nakamurella sp. YIM 132087]|uniref:MFS transporter n=1 Tax=Nakamurella alba TaxID=2665158 RepID=A0A7K1FGN3_9ACTN|nr:MFS transporter [Nakamurella alba]MTD12639.1 MFS transporter [Nakamurella alba]
MVLSARRPDAVDILGPGGSVPTTGSPSGRGPGRFTVAVLAFAGMSAAFMQTLVVPIQAELPALLGTSRDGTAWVITATLLVGAVVMPVAGRLGDMYGKRKVVVGLLAVLTVGSVIAALSTSLGVLVVGRGLQGCGIAVIPLGISILRDLLPPDRLPGSVALISATLGVGGALGLPVSAFVVGHADWHTLFWVAACLATLNIALVLTLVPDSGVRSPARFDAVGAVGLMIGLSGVLLAVSQGRVWGWLGPATLGAGAGGVAVLLLWGWYELRRSAPMVDLRVVARRPVLLTNLASIAMGFALFANHVGLPQLLEQPRDTGVGLGLSLMSASLVMMPSGVMMIAMSPVAGRLTRVVGARVLLIAGALAIAVAYALLLVLDHSVASLLAANLVVGIGIGLGYAAMPTLIMQAVPASETAAANGINALMRSTGTGSAAAVIGAVLAAWSVDHGGHPTPTATAFQVTFAAGLVAAVLSALLAWAVPRRERNFDRDPALPG